MSALIASTSPAGRSNTFTSISTPNPPISSVTFQRLLLLPFRVWLISYWFSSSTSSLMKPSMRCSFNSIALVAGTTSTITTSITFLSAKELIPSPSSNRFKVSHAPPRSPLRDLPSPSLPHDFLTDSINSQLRVNEGRRTASGSRGPERLSCWPKRRERPSSETLVMQTLWMLREDPLSPVHRHRLHRLDDSLEAVVLRDPAAVSTLLPHRSRRLHRDWETSLLQYRTSWG